MRRMDTCTLCKQSIRTVPETWTLPSGEVIHVNRNPVPVACVSTSAGDIDICESCYLRGLPATFSTQVVASAHYEFGLAYRDLGRQMCSIESLKKALRLSETAAILAAIAYAEHQLGNRDSAIKHYEQALSLDPEYFISRENLKTMRGETD